MPKFEIFHKAGEQVSDDIRYLIRKYFDTKEIEKLERLGGRILVSISAPYNRSRLLKEATIDKSFIDTLRSKSKNVEDLRAILDKLSVKQLKELCGHLDQPVRSGATAEEIKRELTRSLQAADFWKRISTRPN